MKKLKFVFCSVGLFLSPFNPIIANYRSSANHDSTLATKNVRSYSAAKLTTNQPVIDGILNDDCWKTGTWTGNFTQWIPKEKGTPSQKTELKILFDEKNIFVAIRAYDNEPEKILRIAGKRDEFVGDIVGVCFDSYHDHRTGFEFDVTAAGQKADVILTNPSNGDGNWNAVWYAKAGLEDSAWVAEMQIPLSQLKFSSDEIQTWGMHCWRWIDRFKEEDDWEVQEQNSPGMLYLFGHLTGLQGLKGNAGIELTPYVLGKLNTFQKEEANPYRSNGRSWLANGGLDGKVGLSSSFTFNFTINPDFGQVEADPSVMNLTAFETFFEEKRPFFLEGKNIFEFGFNDLNVFYTRRIGHAATYQPSLNNNEFLKMPERATIIDALKLSGKTSDGFSVGVLQSLTSDESALISNNGKERSTTVEPMTNYLVGRVQQDYNDGSTILGGIITATNRFIKDDYLDFMNRGAYTGGVDFLHYWNDKEFYVDAKIVGSYIKGDKNAMMLLQSSSARYYQRPDAIGNGLDTSLTSLSGYGGRVAIGKGSKGLWKYQLNLSWRSPGLELNDVGFLQNADLVKQGSTVTYSINQPQGILNSFTAGLTESVSWNYAGEYLYSSFSGAVNFGFTNNWSLSTDLTFNTQKLDTWLLRGGYALKVPSSITYNLNVSSDNSRQVFFNTGISYQHGSENSLEVFSYNAGIGYRPINSLYLSLNGTFSKNTDNLQYVSTIDYANKSHYLLGRLEQETASLTFRIDWNLTPELSIQYYGSPFVAVGKFSEFKQVTSARAENYSDRFSVYNAVRAGDNINLYEKGSNLISANLGNPDFGFSQFRSNLVCRWEYNPGSTIYLVWASDLTSYSSTKTTISNSFDELTGSIPNSIFLIKFNHWFSL